MTNTEGSKITPPKLPRTPAVLFLPAEAFAKVGPSKISTE